jgi:hypothetical protein
MCWLQQSQQQMQHLDGRAAAVVKGFFAALQATIAIHHNTCPEFGYK